MREIAMPLGESECGQQCANAPTRHRTFLDEVEIARNVAAIRPDRDAGTARERDRNARTREVLADMRGQLLGRHVRDALHSGLPLRRGRVRTISSRSRSAAGYSDN